MPENKVDKTITDFVQESIKLEYRRTMPLSLPSIYTLYEEWCEQRRIMAIPRNKFTRTIQSLNFEKGVRPIGRPTISILNGTLDSGLHDRYVQLERERLNGELPLNRTPQYADNYRAGRFPVWKDPKRNSKLDAAKLVIEKMETASAIRSLTSEEQDLLSHAKSIANS